MALLNKYTVGLGIGGISYATGLASIFDQDQGATPMSSFENKRMMFESSYRPGRYIGNDADVSAFGFAGAGMVAGAVLGGGASFAARKFLPNSFPGKDFLNSKLTSFGESGINGANIVTKAGSGLLDFSPKTSAMLLGAVTGGVLGAVAGGYAGSALYDRGVSRLTHNYLNAYGDSDVQGAMQMTAPPTPAQGLGVAGLAIGLYGAHQFGGKQLMSYMARKNDALITAGKAPIRPVLQRAATIASSGGASAMFAAAGAYTVTSKMNSVNTNPNASKIEGLRY